LFIINHLFSICYSSYFFVLKVIAKFIKKGLYYNRIKVRKTGGKGKHSLLFTQEMGVKTLGTAVLKE
jgi:hypothetical protein